MYKHIPPTRQKFTACYVGEAPTFKLKHIWYNIITAVCLIVTVYRSQRISYLILVTFLFIIVLVNLLHCVPQFFWELAINIISGA